MFSKKALVGIVGILFSIVGFSSHASAAAQGGAENFKVDPKAHDKAVAIVAENNDLETSPVPVENLTTQQPAYFSTSNIRAFRSELKFYRIHGIARLSASLGGGLQYRCNYLAPVGFNWNDNRIPSSVWNYQGLSVGEDVVFHNVQDTGTGGYGTGGYYWRYFRTRARNGVYLYFWASAWDLNHLKYG